MYCYINLLQFWVYFFQSHFTMKITLHEKKKTSKENIQFYSSVRSPLNKKNWKKKFNIVTLLINFKFRLTSSWWKQNPKNDSGILIRPNTASNVSIFYSTVDNVYAKLSNSMSMLNERSWEVLCKWSSMN